MTNTAAKVAIGVALATVSSGALAADAMMRTPPKPVTLAEQRVFNECKEIAKKERSGLKEI